MTQIEVLVKDKITGEQRTFTYKSFLDLQDRFDLIGQVDDQGNLIPGDPNLNPRHQKVAVNDVAVHAVDSGMSMEEKLKKRDELLQKYTLPKEEVAKTEPVKVEDTPPPPAEEKQRRKPGPKPKQTA
jgi:hypothetical protein